MDNVDGSDHYTTENKETPPTLLNIVIDTNPRAWALLKDNLPLSKAIKNLQVFINAHLAFNHANHITVIASHVQCAEFLYPRPAPSKHDPSQDVEMSDEAGPNGTKTSNQDDANFYRPFAQVKSSLDASLMSLIAKTEAASITDNYSTSLAGALTLALTYTNKLSTTLAGQTTGLVSSAIPVTIGSAEASASTTLNARILVVSVGSASPTQYIPLMNTVFAAQRMRIPIDVLSIPPLSSSSSTSSNDASDPSLSFLQQAADATSGIFLPLTNPHGLLQTLFLGYLPSGATREMLVLPTTTGVDFRAACFCHRRTVDVGYVCSVCLSIFCEPPEDGDCLTCGTRLKVGGEGWAKKPAVLPRRKKGKRRRREDGDAGTRTGTPAAG